MQSQNILVSKNTEVSAFYIFNTWFFYLEVSICLKYLLLEYLTSLTFQLASFSEQERIKVRPSLMEDEDTDSLWWDSCERVYEQNKPPPPCFGVSKTFLCISSISAVTGVGEAHCRSWWEADSVEQIHNAAKRPWHRPKKPQLWHTVRPVPHQPYAEKWWLVCLSR